MKYQCGTEVTVSEPGEVPMECPVHGADCGPVIGPTGDFPRGKCNPDDAGGIMVGIARSGPVIMMKFGVPIAWFAMSHVEARRFAELLNKLADEAEAES